MTSYQIDLGARSATVGRFVDYVRQELVKAFLEEKLLSGLNARALAEKLALPSSAINGQLAGTRPLTLRAIADLAWALDRSIVFEVRSNAPSEGQNSPATGSVVHYQGSYIHGVAATVTSTLPPPPVFRVACAGEPTKSCAA
ncbi:hypothetical protein MET9862_01732 [Methylobacterium symbioticum]|uniref:HTH cro/C1-type domain-containing protein n=1 Tax=Methylobacterium symbioticum TaxID=2584084 RepID=A0A509EA52_9HYPH|nr:hypothetical protein MET9862_01732 [Methylobacterium symbioticum]